MPIPPQDLQAHHHPIEPEIRAAIHRVLATQQFIQGPEGAALEAALATHHSATHAIGVSSGTDALLATLMALEVGPGDEVLTTPYTFVATASSIARLGARPVFVDIDPATFNLDPAQLERAITPKTRAILPVHLFGQMADMAAIHAVASSRGLAGAVVEDAAQAIAASRDGHPIGHASAAATLSFFPSKNLGAMGDAGMVLTSDDELAARLRRVRNHGQEPKYSARVLGGNFRLDEIQAAILRAKLPYLEGWTAARQRVAARYRALVASAGIPHDRLALPDEAPGVRHVYHQFVVRTARAGDRDALRAWLGDRGMATAVYYPVPVHLQPAFAALGYREGAFPEAERAARETLALPIYPELADEAVERVVAAIAEFFAR